jgi:hypothetical protein
MIVEFFSQAPPASFARFLNYSLWGKSLEGSTLPHSCGLLRSAEFSGGQSELIRLLLLDLADDLRIDLQRVEQCVN